MSVEERAEGYHRSPWPGEDGGPARRQVPRSPVASAWGPGIGLEVTSRMVMAPTMAVLRDPGEVYVLTHTLPITAGPEGTTARLERIDPMTLEPVVSSPELPAGPFWPGGVLAHADGSLYVTYGRWCHRLAPDCSVLAARELPVDRPYNSLVALDDGTLVMKDFVDGTDSGEVSRLLALRPGDLEIVAELRLPEGSIARLSAVGNQVIVVGDHSVMRVSWDGASLRHDDWGFRYRTRPGQTFGWDAVITDDSVWFLDDGAGTEGYAGRFRGVGISEAPLRLWRVPWADADATSVEVCGRPGAIVANPPLIDTDRRVAVGYDSGNGVIAAWRFGAPGDPLGFEPLWSHEQDQAGHMLLVEGAGGRGALISYDHDDVLGEHVVVRDVETGDEWARAAVGSPAQSALFPAVGWDGSVLVTTFTTLARVAPA